jgi:hypothetical protein
MRTLIVSFVEKRDNLLRLKYNNDINFIYLKTTRSEPSLSLAIKRRKENTQCHLFYLKIQLYDINPIYFTANLLYLLLSRDICAFSLK